jgi:hypothetical protein
MVFLTHIQIGNFLTRFANQKVPSFLIVMGNQLFVNILSLFNVISFIPIVLGAKKNTTYRGCCICLSNMGFMTYFRWTTKRNGQMFNPAEIMLVK